MTGSAEQAPSDARATKAELVEQVALLRSRVKELEQDITERKQAEAPLRENEARFRAIIDQLPVSFSLKDTQDRYLMVNRKFEDWFAANGESVTGKSTSDLYDDAFAGQLVDGDRRVRETGEALVQEIVQPFADGSMHTTQVTKFPIKLLDEQTILVGTVAVDITQIKEMENELRNSEERFRTLIENTRGIAYRYLLDDNYTMEYIGGAVEKITGYPVSDFLGREEGPVRTYASIVHPDDAVSIREEIEDAVNGIRDFTIEYRIVHRDGSARWVHSIGAPVIDTTGKLRWIDGTLFDITERKQAEEDIRRNREQLIAILESGPIGIAVTLRDSGKTVYANSRFAEQLGLGEDRNLGRNLNAYWADPMDRTNVIGRTKEFGFVEDVEVQRRRSDGSDFWALMSAMSITYEGQDALLSWTYDNTERRRIEQELVHKEAQLRVAMDNMPGAIVVVDKDLNLVLVNEQYKDFYGDADGLTMPGNSMRDILRKEIALGYISGEGGPEEILEQRLATFKSTKTLVFRDTARGGRIIQVTRKPTPEGFTVSVATDITERRRIEQQLRENEERLKSILEASPVGATIVNIDGTFEFVNSRMANMVGLSKEQFLASNARDLYVDPAERDEVSKRLAKEIRLRDVESLMKKSDGTPFWVLVSFEQTGLEGGKQFFGWVYDIDARKKAQDRFKALLESAPDATVIVNADGDIVQSNRQTEQLFGYAADELLGKKVETLLPDHLRERHPGLRNQFFKDARARPMGIGLELFGRARDSREFPIELSLSPIDTDEGTLVSAAVRDITERKQAEREVHAARERAETALADLTKAQARLVTTEKLASLGQLTAGIAHEIKNPLNFVNNFSETSVELLDELKEVLEPVHGSLDQDARDDVDDIFDTLKGDLQRINQHGKRADSIVKSMLLHARGDASERMPTPVNDLVEEAFKLAYHGERARDKSFNVTMEQDFDEAAGEAVLVPQELTRVLVNLLSNAFYAVKKRGRDAGPDAYAPTVAVRTADKGQAVEIRVRDNGTGMPKDVREKLFDPFFTTKPTGEGTGLGLSMSFDIIVHQHGGKIDVDSKPGAFTEFVITLPRQPPEDNKEKI